MVRDYDNRKIIPLLMIHHSHVWHHYYYGLHYTTGSHSVVHNILEFNPKNSTQDYISPYADAYYNHKPDEYVYSDLSTSPTENSPAMNQDVHQYEPMSFFPSSDNNGDSEVWPLIREHLSHITMPPACTFLEV